MQSQILDWKFDPISARVAIFVAPILVVMTLVIWRFVTNSAKYVLIRFVYGLNKTFLHKTRGPITLEVASSSPWSISFDGARVDNAPCQIDLAGKTKAPRAVCLRNVGCTVSLNGGSSWIL